MPAPFTRTFPWHTAAIAVAGLGLGDEGKGATVDALVRRFARTVVVRHGGGPQAAHHVVRHDGAVHCFAQFGAGTLVPGVRTFLGPHMLVEPLALVREADALAAIAVPDALARLTISAACPIVTPFHRLLGRIQELVRGPARHGSCGLGVGAAYVDAHNPAVPTLRFHDLLDRETLRRKLRLIQLMKLDLAEQLAEHHDLASPSSSPASRLSEPAASPRHVDIISPAYPSASRRIDIISPAYPSTSRRIDIASPAYPSTSRRIDIASPAQPTAASLLAELARPDLVAGLLSAYAALADRVSIDHDQSLLTPVLRDSPASVVFEGAQGLLLDADRGFWPYVSPGAPGFEHALALLADAGAPPPLRLGVLRAYATRHGPGPLVSEDAALTALLPEMHNQPGAWQGPMRIGWFDLVATHHALAIAGHVDGLVLTCLDRLAALPRRAVCTAYRDGETQISTLPPPTTDRAARTELTHRLQRCTPELTPLACTADAYARHIADALQLPLACIATGPTATDRTWAPTT